MVSPTLKTAGRAFVLTVLALVFFLLDAQSAAAHSRLETSSPVSGSALSELPAAITLRFSEPVVPSSVSMQLEQEDGGRLSLGHMTVSDDNRSVVVLIDQTANVHGALQLRWAVRSATDGHDSAGLVAFTVGTGRAPFGVTLGNSQRDAWWLIAVRTIWLLAMAGIVARMIAHFSDGRRPTARWSFGAGAVCMIAAVLTVRPWADFDSSSPATRWLLAAGTSGLIAALLAGIPNAKMWPIAAGFWAGASIALVNAGHAAVDISPWIARTAGATHSILALLWIGALAAIALNISATEPQRSLSTYSRVALWGVLCLASAGILLAAIALPDQRTVTSSAFGRTMLVKTAVVIAAVAIAGANRWISRRHFDRRTTDAVAFRQARWLLLTELAILATAAAFAAALASTAPPARSAIVQVASPSRIVDQAAISGDLKVILRGQITGDADDRIWLSITGQDGSEAGAVQRVIIATSYLDPKSGSRIPGERFDADQSPDNPGSWSFSALRLSRQAIWTIAATVRRADLLDVETSFSVDTTTWQAEQPRIVSRSWHWPIVPAGAWALLAVAIVVPAGGLYAIRRNSQVSPFAGAILFFALAAIAAGFAVQAWQRSAIRSQGHGLSAPAETDLVAAASVYQARCLACHGAGGAGADSTAALHQHRANTNLTDPGSRAISDGDLYTLVSDGVGDSDMPAFDRALTSEQRWNLVAYIRTLQSAKPPQESEGT